MNVKSMVVWRNSVSNLSLQMLCFVLVGMGVCGIDRDIRGDNEVRQKPEAGSSWQ